MFSSDMVGAVFTRTAVLMSLLHGKGLLLTHGYESFGEYITNFFDLTTKDKKNVNFLKSLKDTDVYKEFATHLDESRSTKNHPKLRKLVEILVTFFKDPKHARESKVIVFSQFRESAKEIKNYLDKKSEGFVKSELFVGQNNNGLNQKM